MNDYKFPQCSTNQCEEDGCYHCRLCGKNWCFEHLCIHLVDSQEKENDSRRLDDLLQTDEIPQHGKPKNEIIFNLSEQQLRSELRRCFVRAKELQHELERRMIECSGFNYKITNQQREQRYNDARIPKEFRPRALAKGALKERKLQNSLQQLIDLGFTREQIIKMILKPK